MKAILIKIYRKIYRIQLLRPIAFIIYYIGLTKWFNDIVDWMDVYIFQNKFENENLFYKKNENRVIKNLEVLADEKSRVVYKSLINYRKTHRRRYLRGIVDNVEEMYFDHDIVKLGQNEVFCECGAYNGDTLRIISSLMLNNNFKNWWAIALECEDRNFKLLERQIRKDVILRQHVLSYKIATWNEKTTLFFDSGMEQSSRVSDVGSVAVNADSIDHIIDDLKNYDCYNLMSIKYGDKISFIIMDVEGAELPSIQGAYNTILNYRPRLAISIYHSEADMVDIIEYIHETWPFYKLYVRHYTWLYTETILYAIP